MTMHPMGCPCGQCAQNNDDDDDTTSATTHVGPRPASSQDESDEEPNYECKVCGYETELSDHKKETQAWCDGDCECISWFKKI